MPTLRGNVQGLYFKRLENTRSGGYPPFCVVFLFRGIRGDEIPSYTLFCLFSHEAQEPLALLGIAVEERWVLPLPLSWPWVSPGTRL